MYFVGFDPGGKNAFGWAVLVARSGQLELVDGDICTGAPTALEAVARVLPRSPAAIGVDAPLFWALSGDRRADLSVRKLVREADGSPSTVGHVNSLRGACLVQGVLVARMARDRWPSARFTEAHPKALLAVSGEAKHWIASIGLRSDHEHVRDAVLAGFAAHALIAQTPGWEDLAAQELHSYYPGGEKVAYYFPRQSD